MSLDNSSEIAALLEQFNERFGVSEQLPSVFFAPGRVNLLGDHTDYTGGMVFPCGITQGTWLAVRRTGNRQYRFASSNFDYEATLEHSQTTKAHGDEWINYPLGVLDQFQRRGIITDGFDLLYSGNVPNGAGLSSSASVEVVTAFAINEIMQAGLSLIELAKLSQAAENDFVGMQCGIMDQFAISMAKRSHGIMLDCGSLEYRHVPLNLDGISIVVSNTNQRRELNDSAYNARVSECARALELLAPVLNISALGELLPEKLNEHKGLFTNDPVPLMRARHVCMENTRVRAAVPALESGDIKTFGKLMDQSHHSLRDLYQVSSEPLDHLVTLACAQAGVLGSRLTGAGFGGCTVSLMKEQDVSAFEQNVGEKYEKLTGLTADFYTMSAGAGVRRLGGESLGL